MEDVIIVGAGAAGLAVYYRLNKLGIKPRILDAGDQIASSWRVRHPQLRLNTLRWFSHQPGMKIPGNYGRWVSKDDYINYLENYVRKFKIPVEFNTKVLKLEKLDKGWLVKTNRGDFYSKHVIMSCGANRIPRMPNIPGLDSFGGVIRHSNDFGDVSQYDNKRVLIIGGGNSAFDMANHLNKRPVLELLMSIRTTPAITAKEVFGFPMHILAALLRNLPTRIQDYLFHSTQNNIFGNLKKYNLGETPRNVYTKHAKDGITVSVDEGFVKAVKQGRARVVKEIIEVNPNSIKTIDGEELQPDVILCATGYDSGLESIISHLSILDICGIPTTTGSQVNPKYPGLWFIGLRGYIWGNMYEQLRQSKRLANIVFHSLRNK
jgi:putative flavoprotein involved in K+ transport